MALTVLSDQDINNLLESLTADEAEALALSLKSTLHEYSTGTQGPGAFHQPERTVVHDDASNVTTLFMPSSCSRRGHGVKVVTLSGPGGAPDGRPPIKPTGTVTLFGPDGAPQGLVHAKTLTAFRTALASTCLLQKRAAVRTLVAFGAGAQAYWHVRLALLLRGPTVRDVYLINHQYSDAARQTLQKLYAIPAEVRRREGWEQTAFSLLTPGFGEFDRLLKEYLRAADVVYCCTPSTEPLFDASILTNTEGRKKGRLIVAIGSYKPGMRELPRALLEQAVKPTHGATGFLHLHKHATEGGVIIVDTIDGCLKEAGELIEAGLEPRQLVELGELVMIKRAMMQEDEDGSIISGSSTDVSSDMDKLDLTSGTPSMSTVFGSDGASTTGSSSKRSSSGSPKRKGSGLFPRRSSSSASTEQARKGRDDHLSRWLTAGNVVYKSVGMGLMDLVVGMDVVQLAREKGVGTLVGNFS